MNAVLPPVEGAEVRGALDRICNAAWKAAHPERAQVAGGHGDEPRERRLADALVALARGPVGTVENGRCGSAAGQVPAVIVTVDAETLRTTLLPDTPLDPSVLTDLLPRSQVYGAIRDHTNPARLSFGRNRRLASPMQRLVLAMLQPRCMVGGCDVPAQRCEAHHVVEFDAGGSTDMENLVNLCPAHHHHWHGHQNSLVSPGSTSSAGLVHGSRHHHQDDEPRPPTPTEHQSNEHQSAGHHSAGHHSAGRSKHCDPEPGAPPGPDSDTQPEAA